MGLSSRLWCVACCGATIALLTIFFAALSCALFNCSLFATLLGFLLSAFGVVWICDGIWDTEEESTEGGPMRVVDRHHQQRLNTDNRIVTNTPQVSSDGPSRENNPESSGTCGGSSHGQTVQTPSSSTASSPSAFSYSRSSRAYPGAAAFSPTVSGSPIPNMGSTSTQSPDEQSNVPVSRESGEETSDDDLD